MLDLNKKTGRTCFCFKVELPLSKNFWSSFHLLRAEMTVLEEVNFEDAIPLDAL